MVDEYNGAWIETASGSKIHLLNPRSEEIKIEDIAHHLSLLCRFTGACSKFYSVAEHSIRVADLVPVEYALPALLHDAAEAYIGDISRPVKYYLHNLDTIEKLITKAIGEKFNVRFDIPEIWEADNILLATEARDLMPNMDGWAKLPPPLEKRIVPFFPSDIERAFLTLYHLFVKHQQH